MGSRIFPRHHNLTDIRSFAVMLLIPILWLVLSLSTARAEWTGYFSTLAFDDTGYDLPLVACSDGNAGQSFIATYLDGGSVFPITIKKYDRTGNPMWGVNGKVLPLDPTTTQLQPLAMETDFNGGVYISYRGLSGTQYIVWLAHLNQEGILTWNAPVGDFMTDSEYVSIRLAGDNSAAPGCLVGWSQYDDTTFPDRAMAAFVDLATGNVLWQTETGISAYISFSRDSEWTVKTDGQGGFLVGRFDGLQRLGHDGTLMFGTGGLVLANLNEHLAELVPDGSGGGYVLTHALHGGLVGQHVDAAGNITWGTNGLVLAPFYAHLCNSSICSDNAGGFVFVTGYEDLVAQRFDVNGAKLWGSGGVILTTLSSDQLNPDVIPDGFGGFLLAYEDYYFSSSGNKPAISVIRLDSFGNVLWRKDGVFWDYSPSVGNISPRVMSDGWAGASVAWKVYTESVTGNQIGIGSLDFDGECPPVCRLTYCDPSYGAPGPATENILHGQYLDSQNEYVLRDGGQEFPLVFLELEPGGGGFQAQVDLSAAPSGVYDVVARKNSNLMSELVGVYGVDNPLPSGLIIGIPDYSTNYASIYGRRASAVDDQGGRYQTWIRHSWGTPPSQIMLWYDNGGVESVESVLETTDQISDLSFTAPTPADRYYTFITYDGSIQKLGYMHNGSVQYYQQPVPDIFSPMVAINPAGQVLIVFNSWNSGLNVYQLKSVEVDDNGFGQVVDLGAGNNTMEPDLVGTDTGFTLTFVRDLWIPGAREVCYQQYENSLWGVPVGVGFGWEVTRPSVAWDGLDDLLFAYVVNNFDGDRTVFTTRLHNGVLEATRRVKGAPEFPECLVSGGGDDQFYLVTQGGATTSQTSIEVYPCDGQVVFPPLALTLDGADGIPCLAANPGGDVSVSWRPNAGPGDPYHFVRWDYTMGVSPVPATPLARFPLQAWPNPFNPRTVLRFSLSTAENVSLGIYDISGRCLRNLHRGLMEPGNHEFVWNGIDEGGRRVSSGVYFARLTGSVTRQVTKITLLK